MPPHCPVKPSYKKFLHVLHVESSPTDSSHTQADHAARLVNGSNPANNRFIIVFTKLSRATSSTRKATHQGSNSANAYLGT
jgi:hypothetical protein